MTSAYDQLTDDGDRIAGIARNVHDATKALARAANGNRTPFMPAPTAYRVLGELKVSLWNLQEVLEFMPYGLSNTLHQPDVDIYDRNHLTGEDRDPKRQVAVASEHLTHIVDALHHAAELMDATQAALGGQGFEPRQSQRTTPAAGRLHTRDTARNATPHSPARKPLGPTP